MKKLCIMIFFFCSAMATNAQEFVLYGGSNKMATVSYRLPKLVITDSLYLAKLDSLILDSGHYSLTYGEKYLRIFGPFHWPSEKADRIVAQLSHYPILFEDGIGYFEHRGYTVMIWGKLPYVFYATTKKTKRFRYKDYVDPNTFDMIEDDVFTWKIDYKKDGSISLNYPNLPKKESR